MRYLLFVCSILGDAFPNLYKFLQWIDCVCGTCGWQFYCVHMCLAFAVFFIKLECGVAVCINLLDMGDRQDSIQIIGNDVFDAAVAGAFDFAGSNHIPDRNLIIQQKLFLFFDCLRYFAVENFCEHLPKTILWVVVEEVSFPWLYRWERAENQYFLVPIKNRFDFVKNSVHKKLLYF